MARITSTDVVRGIPLVRKVKGHGMDRMKLIRQKKLQICLVLCLHQLY